jgi:hypothetical protein
MHPVKGKTPTEQDFDFLWEFVKSFDLENWPKI